MRDPERKGVGAQFPPITILQNPAIASMGTSGRRGLRRPLGFDTRQAAPALDLDHEQLRADRLVLGESLGRGAFGCVSKGLYSASAGSASEALAVAEEVLCCCTWAAARSMRS